MTGLGIPGVQYPAADRDLDSGSHTAACNPVSTTSKACKASLYTIAVRRVEGLCDQRRGNVLVQFHPYPRAFMNRKWHDTLLPELINVLTQVPLDE